MEKNEKVRNFRKKKDVLDDLIERGEADEMSLLDLIFIEEMLSQTKMKKQDELKNAIKRLGREYCQSDSLPRADPDRLLYDL